ncbi:hypothetical protein ACEPAI_3149 [Sanghuangporus weigelae]
MSGYRNFAVSGAGTIGKLVVAELVKKKDEGAIASVTILTRSLDGHKDLVDKGVKVVAVDYTSPSSLESALSDIDVLISTLGLLGIGHQTALATSAKAAGVKLFVPSDFGSDPHGQTQNPIFAQKVAIQQKLKELSLPYATFYTGLFTEKVLVSNYAAALGLNFATGEFSIPGSGTADISWTTAGDAAQFVVYALAALPREKIEWRIFRIEGDRLSFDEIASVWEKHSGNASTVSHRPRITFEEAVQKNPMDFISLFILALDDGLLTVGNPGDLSNSDYPGWKSKKVIDVLSELYAN